MKLRSYQQAAVDAIYEHLRSRVDNPVAVLPTGAGKSLVLAKIASDAVQQWNGRVLILAHVRELLEQNADKIRKLCPNIKVGLYSAGLKRRESNTSVLVAGIQSIYKRACDFDPFDLIVVDEAHLISKSGDGMYRQFLADCKVINPLVRVIGEPSGWLVDVDLDCPEAIALADEYLPPTHSITGRPSALRSHRWYIAVGAKTEKHTDPTNGSMIVELRSTGAQTVVGPSIHPSGELYETLSGEPAVVPAPMLAACVRALAEASLAKRSPRTTVNSNSPIPQFLKPPVRLEPRNEIESRAIAYIAAMPAAISGSSGHSQTYAAATALIHGFGINSDTAFAILASYYNPRCEPPWSEKELRHKINSAATKPHDRPFGWLRDDQLPTLTNDVDLSKFQLGSSKARDAPSEQQRLSTSTNPFRSECSPTDSSLD